MSLKKVALRKVASKHELIRFFPMPKDKILTSYCVVFSSESYDKEAKDNLNQGMITEGLENDMYEKWQWRQWFSLKEIKFSVKKLSFSFFFHIFEGCLNRGGNHAVFSLTPSLSAHIAK